MKTWNVRWGGLVLAATFMMAACGGGGGSSSSTPPPPTTYTVTYSGNGSTGGTVPVDAAAYQQGQTVTVLGNTGSLAQTGDTFGGWNTVAGGTGAAYTAGQTFTMGAANVSLYAQWSPSGPTALAGQLIDASVAGVCYLASPSGQSGTTTAAGNYTYVAGDSVAFWLPVNGSPACGSAPAATSKTALPLGTVIPTAPGTGLITQTFVTSLPNGQLIAQALTALNHGSPSPTGAMDVSGISLPAADVAKLNLYLAIGVLPLGQSINGFFNAIQTDAFIGSTLSPALPVSATVASGALSYDLVVSQNLIASATAIGTATGTKVINLPAQRLMFSSSSGTYQSYNTSTGAPTTSSVFTTLNFTYYNGGGNGYKLKALDGSPTPDPYAMTYSVAGNVITQNYGIYSASSATAVESNNVTIQYSDGTQDIFTGAYEKDISAGGAKFQTGSYSGSSQVLTPLSRTGGASTVAVAGYTITLGDGYYCPSGGPDTFTFDSTGSTFTSLCNPGVVFTLAPDARLPGLLVATDPRNGGIAYIGLLGSSLRAGSSIAEVVAVDPSGGTYPGGLHPIASCAAPGGQAC